MADTLDRLFHLRDRQTTVAREARGAVATFLTMAYILAVNPDILSGGGWTHDSAVACTAAAAGRLLPADGVLRRFPLATAPGMGLNAFVAFTLAKQAGSWQAAMGVIVLDGLVMLALVLAGLREAVMDAIPRDLRLATGAGIGLFIAFLGLVNGKLVVPGQRHARSPTACSPTGDHTAVVAVIGLRRHGRADAVPGAGRDPDRHRRRHGGGVPAARRPLPPGWRPWAAPSFANAFHADVRGALRLAAAAGVVRRADGRLLRHPRHRHRHRRAGRPGRRRRPRDRHPPGADRRLPRGQHRRPVRRQQRDGLHRERGRRGRGGPHRPAHGVRRPAVLRRRLPVPAGRPSSPPPPPPRP